MTISTFNRLLNINDLAEQLGMSKATIYQRRSKRKPLPRAINIGGRIRWTQESVDNFLEQMTENV